MYDLTTRKSLARRYANPAHIPVYRQMLKEMRRPCSSRIGFDQRQLAEDFLYMLLGCCTMEAIQQRAEVRADDFRDVTKMVVNPTQATTMGNIEAVSGSAAVRRLAKAEEYPDINWRNLDDPLVRLADSLYSDRINCWRRLKELEAATQDNAVASEILSEIITLTIRHELCFQELRNFNDKGCFLGCHPFITQKDEREQLLQLLRTNPDAYFEARKNIELNISRYSSQINGKKASDAAKARARENLERHQAKLAIYREVFQEFTATK